MTTVTTTALWLSCLAVGIIGIWVPYHRSQSAARKPPPMQAELIDVSLTSDSTPIDDPAPANRPEMAAVPPAAKLTLAPAPFLTPVATPSPSIAFAVPVTGPTKIIEAKNAAYSAPNKPTDEEGVLPPVAQLTVGHGEGKQPIDYPARAIAEGQEGTVQIEFTVGVDGRTLSAEIVSRSPWRLLNDAALKSVRERWHLSPGPIRRYVVPIHFKIRK